MKIINWNCKMKFREEYKSLLPFNPDIMVIPECEDMTIPLQSDSFWEGSQKSKGLGVFTFNDFKIELYKNYSDEFKYIIPLILKNNKQTFHLIAVWTQMVGPKVKNHKNYINQFRLSLDYYKEFLSFKNVIIAGDFNSNLIWKSGLDKDHQNVINTLSTLNIQSAYHHYFKEEQGKELQPTYYHYHQKKRPFHIDFCFLSNNLLNQLNNVEVGLFDDWIHLSDHVPMITEF